MEYVNKLIFIPELKLKATKFVNNVVWSDSYFIEMGTRPLSCIILACKNLHIAMKGFCMPYFRHAVIKS